jgi:hypothetical protein
MKFFVTTRLNLVLLAAVSFSAMFLTVFGQECSNEAGRITCASSQEYSCEIKDGKFDGKCFSTNQELFEEGKEDEFDADYATKVTGKEVTVADLKRNAALREGLRRGKITTSDGRATTSFTPIDQVKTKIRLLSINSAAVSQPVRIDESSLQTRFNKIRKESSLDEALTQYLKLLNNPLLNTPMFLEKLGDELVAERNLTDAIKVLEVNAEIKKTSDYAYLKLAEAYQRRYRMENKAEDREKAIANYEKVLASRSLDEPSRALAIKRLKGLRQPL